MSDHHDADAIVEHLKPDFITLSDAIWDQPELRYAETHASAAHAAILEKNGFKVTRNVTGIPTALMAESGKGGPVIAFLGEFDALAGLSQQAGVAQHAPVEQGGNGHGCGHNLLGAASLLAAAAARDYLKSRGLPGRIRYYGCPAEEGGSGKTFMARDGAFKGVDAVLAWHPGSFNCVMPARSLANIQAYFRFHGRASHAAASPELGRSGVDAMELMSVGVQYLREHMPSDARVHSAIINGGGISPNVVQDFAEVLYLIRSPDLTDVQALFGRVTKIAEGAALMTETRMEVEVDKACSSMLINTVMNETLQAQLVRLENVGFDRADRELAERMRAALTEKDVRASYGMIGHVAPAESPLLAESIYPIPPANALLPGSTDVADVSWQAPLAQCVAATATLGTPMHSWQLVAHGKSSIAHRGLTFAAKAMAGAAVTLFESPELLDKAQAEFRERTARTPYQCPIGPEVELPFRRHQV